MVGQKNAHKFSVGTQDLELRQKLRSIPGVPLFYIKNSVCILEPHSHITEQTAEKIEIQKTLPESFENIPKGASESGIKKAKKKKRSNEPNPLSCKKPKTKPADNTEIRETSTSEKPKKKKRGSRGHGSKHVKELEV
jgi:U3 small nucleolar RNA-associated protein 23